MNTIYPNCHYQIVTFYDVTKMSLQNCHFSEFTKLSPYQIVITKLTLPKIRPLIIAVAGLQQSLLFSCSCVNIII